MPDMSTTLECFFCAHHDIKILFIACIIPTLVCNGSNTPMVGLALNTLL